MDIKMAQNAEPYDVNFCFPIRELSNDLVKLTPFIVRSSLLCRVTRTPSNLIRNLAYHLQPAIHADTFFALSYPHPELYTHLPFGPFPSAANFVDQLIEGRIQRDPALILFAVIDKTRAAAASGNDNEGALAGTIGFLNTSAANLCTEIGFVITLPPFQRTHVTSNAVGLLLQYALDLPSPAEGALPLGREKQGGGGLGLRRVQWQANSLNLSSIRAAERMGFKHEAVLRWDRVLREGREMGKVGNGREVAGDIGRDSVMLSLCWDDWEDGGREKVLSIMKRRQRKL